MADRKTVLRPDVAEEGTDRDRLFKNVPEKKTTISRYQLSWMMEEMPNDF